MDHGTYTRVLNGVANAQDAAANQRIYDEMRGIALRLLNHEPGGPAGIGTGANLTLVVNEAWLKLSRNDRWDNRAHFFGAAARAMRQVLVDEARRRGAAKRAGKARSLELDPPGGDSSLILSRALEIDEALLELADVDPRAARVAEFRLFGDLTDPTVAELLEVSTRTIERDWRFAKAWIADFLGSD